LAKVEVNRSYRMMLPEPAEAACYLQGMNEATHGISDSLLSVLARRAQDITTDMLRHRAERSAATTHTLERIAGR
jgi:L-ornithine N5-oxygenase